MHEVSQEELVKRDTPPGASCFSLSATAGALSLALVLWRCTMKTLLEDDAGALMVPAALLELRGAW